MEIREKAAVQRQVEVASAVANIIYALRANESKCNIYEVEVVRVKIQDFDGCTVVFLR